MSIYKHKFIVFAIDHFNSLGIIRSLGEKGIVKEITVMDIKPNVP